MDLCLIDLLQLILHKLKTNMDEVQHERLNRTIFEQVDLQQEKILVLNEELDTTKTMQLILQLELLNVEMKVDVGWTKVSSQTTLTLNHFLIAFLSEKFNQGIIKVDVVWYHTLVQPTSTFISTLSNSSCRISCIVLVVSSSSLSTSIFSCWRSTCSNIVRFNRSCWTSSIFVFNLCKISCMKSFNSSYSLFF